MASIASGAQITLGAALAAFRDHIIVQAEIGRALREPDLPAAPGRAQELDFPPDLVARLCAFAEADGEGGSRFLTGALADEVRQHLAAAPGMYPLQPSADGAARRRAQAALGRAAILRKMQIANDRAVAKEPVRTFAAKHGLRLTPAQEALFRMRALDAMADVEAGNAQRELGILPPAGQDPCLELALPMDRATHPLQPGPLPAALPAPGLMDTPPTPAACPAPQVDAALAQAAAGPSAVPAIPAPVAAVAAQPLMVSKVLSDTITELEGSKTKKVTKKVLRDYRVARDLFLELVGDMPVAEVTADVCGHLRELLSTVPAMHGKGGTFAGMTAPESIAKADADDEVQETMASIAGDPDTARLHARLSYATINKHLTSLQTCMGSQLTLDRTGRTPLLAVRFSKAEVRENPAFRRSQLSDERLVAIFHGPAFTGFRDADNRRFEPGQKLIADGCYWVPLLSLYSGMCLEEALQLHPDDIKTEDGIPAIDIGAIHDGRPTAVKNHARVRLIPIHPALIDLGFLDYVASKRRAGEKRLFPGLERGGPDGRFGHEFTQWWTSYRRAIGAYARGQDFHSLRHGVNKRLIRAKVPLPVVKRILGHSPGADMNLAIYYGEVDLADMAEGIRTLSYPCLDLELLKRRQASLTD